MNEPDRDAAPLMARILCATAGLSGMLYSSVELCRRLAAAGGHDELIKEMASELAQYARQHQDSHARVPKIQASLRELTR